MYISWIIPVKNGEHLIEKGVREVDAYLRGKNFPGGFEIIVMADSTSKDKTVEMAERTKSVNSVIRVVASATGGKGGAVRGGMLAASGDIRLFSDVDNATSPGHFDKMLPLFEKGADVVISSRDPRDAAGAFMEVPESFVRQLAGKTGNLIIQIFAVWGIWDTQNGFKAFTKRAAEEIFSRAKIQGFAFDIEMLALARKLHYRIAVIPVLWKHQEESTVTLKSYIQVFIDVFKIRWNIIMGHYKFP
ncbi:MAG: hypothetical protein A3I44_02560 [Candidatus Sungbacteria bacterium RIFCSPLOWO2_02_FULL_51_17]|uniref:Glycosyltransferase 2-like domain-containing protein n=1 Tax=Candidatus Sungbacteria bacterium RIFCSPHIGHO2_02_FULL_51_29 TaxID=1802273 RepID=A0A1G2KT20_9BACT|nr:MAG: hypothetical protein A2676_00240 [Candidatus Sungbacteria bacterium RIFCSPHIGHO2_01_FULL_51_22]OHA02473.1 MAG: hypothetical protein A3C16_05350 [Candidatus Sungbacteria bacterium RIFCSPHIGHO2_02_FULL_51_29]OHA06749.1 MAG: hypothetical protein A3B29_00955 [Candidatus Sungbacteria bacterium RIFCSPLOWO2_01_FULL_51_34]OHA11949.1 MAG: hypothetical protein A3I44_02560 [Candidatus Sungbacteria bacterium RIFCSPLOWO2_02_FULL_51_17]